MCIELLSVLLVQVLICVKLIIIDLMSKRTLIMTVYKVREKHFII